jgi:hypothetical protein
MPPHALAKAPAHLDFAGKWTVILLNANNADETKESFVAAALDDPEGKTVALLTRSEVGDVLAKLPLLLHSAKPAHHIRRVARGVKALDVGRAPRP